MEFNFNEDLKINLDNLHQEWLKQPVLYMQYAEAAALASRAKDETKNKLEVVRAKIDLEIRNDPNKFDLAKITETAINNVILLQSKYQEILEEYHQAKYECDIMIAAIRAFDQRKSALENEVKLWAGAYFSDPKGDREDAEKLKDRASENTVTQQRRKLNENKEEH